MAAKFIGQYKMEKTENLDGFMRQLGVNMMLRKIGNSSSPTLIMEHIEGDHYKVQETTTFKSHTWDFTIGQEFKDKTVDGRQVLTTFTLDGEKLVHSEKPASGSGKSPSYTWKLTADNNLTLTYELEGVVCNRLYKREK